MVNCGTEWWLDFQLNNTGGVTFQSLSLAMVDSTAGTGTSLSSDGFINRDHCPWDLDTRAGLAPGGSRVVSSPILTVDPTGHAFVTEITVCSEIGRTGTCVAQTVNFTAP
jgi:hypothetical protein